MSFGTNRILLLVAIAACLANTGAFAQSGTEAEKPKEQKSLPAHNPAPEPHTQRDKLPQPDRDWMVSKAPPDAAFGAYQRGLFITAFKEALKRIEQSDNAASAMTLVGELYRDGLGLRQDHKEAVRWYRLAAARGDRQAMFALGRAYLEGKGVDKNEDRAREHFSSAAAKGHAAALYNLGIMALGVPTKDNPGDPERAAGFFRQAAQGGDIDATYSLAVLYRRGLGVEKDDEKATTLLKQAADEYHLGAMVEYAIALFNGVGTPKDEKASAQYFIRAAWKNSPVAQNRLARLYASGRGVKRDMIQAMTWHIIARAGGIKDKWLDDHLPSLTRTQREIVDQQVRKFARK